MFSWLGTLEQNRLSYTFTESKINLAQKVSWMKINDTFNFISLTPRDIGGCHGLKLSSASRQKNLKLLKSSNLRHSPSPICRRILFFHLFFVLFGVKQRMSAVISLTMAHWAFTIRQGHKYQAPLSSYLSRFTDFIFPLIIRAVPKLDLFFYPFTLHGQLFHSGPRN